MDSIREAGAKKQDFELEEKQSLDELNKQSGWRQASKAEEPAANLPNEEIKLVDSEIKARSFDLVIFGATGAVGKFVVEELALVLEKNYSHNRANKQQHDQRASTNELDLSRNVAAQTQRRRSVPRPMSSGVNWAVAGRSSVRLNETLCRAELCTGTRDLSMRVPLILADLNHQRSLVKMCSRTNLVVNCAGPFAADGEALVKACLKTKTNYIDLCHETTFIEQIRRKYSEQARQAGIYIINGCGFQSMSAEIGLNFIKQVVDGQIDEVKIILNLSDTSARIRPKGRQLSGTNFQSSHCGIVTRGMWQSLLIDKAQQISFPASDSSCIIEKNEDEGDRSVKRTLLRKDTQSLVSDTVEFRNKNSLAGLELIKGLRTTNRGYCLPTSSLTGDNIQLVRGEMANYNFKKPDLESGWRPIKCTSWFTFKSFKQLIVALIWFMMFNILVRFSHARTLMGWFPFISSLGHVKTTRKALDRASLSHIKYSQTFIVYGIPSDDDPSDSMDLRDNHSKHKSDQLLTTEVVGPEPNHVATSTFVVQAALTLVTEKDHLPAGGGVITPGAAFLETNIIYQLRKRNIKFEVLRQI